MPTRFVMVLRRITAAGLAGAIAGILVAGLGGRVVMTVAALINPDATGLLTDFGAVIGTMTVKGTLALLAFSGLFSGLAAGIVWVVVSPWLPRDGRRRKLAAAAGAVVLGGPLLVQSGNRDFDILDHDAILVAMLLSLVALVGLAVAWLDARLDRRLPRPTGTAWPLGVAYGVVALLGLLVLQLVIGFYFSREVCGCGDPPALIGWGLVATGLVTLASWVLLVGTGREEVPPPVRAAGRLALLVAVGLGTVRVVGELTRILGPA